MFYSRGFLQQPLFLLFRLCFHADLFIFTCDILLAFCSFIFCCCLFYIFVYISIKSIYSNNQSLCVGLLGPRIIVDSGYYIPYQKGIPTVEIILVIGQSWVQASLSKKLYPHCLVLVGSRNVFDRDFRSKKSH